MGKFRAYISCSEADERWGARLERALSRYRAPAALRRGEARRIGPVFRHHDERPTTRDIGDERRAALEQSDSLIVICGPGAARSIWIDEEIRSFRRRRPGGRILGLIVEGEGAPEALRTLEGPAARMVDARDGRWKAAAQEAAAFCLGVTLEEIASARRVQRRRRVIGAGAATAGAMVLAGSYYVVDLAERREEMRVTARALAAQAQEALDRGESLSALRAIGEAFDLPLPETEPELLAALTRASLETRLLADFLAPSEDIIALRALPDGALAVVGADGGAYTVNLETGAAQAVYEPRGRTFSRVSADGGTFWTAHFGEAKKDETGAPYTPLFFEETDLATGETRLATAVRSLAGSNGVGEISPDGALFAVDLGPGAGAQTIIGVFRREEQELAGVLPLASDRADLWFSGPENILVQIDPPSAYESAPGLYLWRVGAETPTVLRAPGSAPVCHGAEESAGMKRPRLLLTADRSEAGLMLGDEKGACLLRWSLPSGAMKPALTVPAGAAAGAALGVDGPYLFFTASGETVFMQPGREARALPGCGSAGARALENAEGRLAFFCQKDGLSSLMFGARAGMRWSRAMHEGGVTAAAYDRERRRLITVGRDARIRVWDAAPRAEPVQEMLSAQTLAKETACETRVAGEIVDRVNDATGARLALRAKSETGDERLVIYDTATCSRLLAMNAQLTGAPQFDGPERLLLPLPSGVAALSLAIDEAAARKALRRRLARLGNN